MSAEITAAHLSLLDRAIFIREQGRLPPCVQEQNCLIFLKKPVADQINHPRSGASRIDWIQQETFVLRKQIDRFLLLFG